MKRKIPPFHLIQTDAAGTGYWGTVSRKCETMHKDAERKL
jgi:hypothetical protein